MSVFRMYGRIIEINRYKVDYDQEQVDVSETGEMIITTEQQTSFFPTLEEAESVPNGTVTALDTENWEWLDGLEMPDVPDTYAEAIKIMDMGKKAYEQKIAFDKSKTNDKIRADLDFMMLMQDLN